MKKYILYIIAAIPIFCSSCIKEEELDNTPKGNFETLWNIIDKKYCFLDYKQQEYGLDWNVVHNKYEQRISPSMTNKALFEVLGDMLEELHDGHVNLYCSLGTSRYWKWFEDYPKNFDDSIQRNYLGTNYGISSGLKYKIFDDNIGYIYVEDFSTAIGSGNLSEVLNELSLCNGLIIDVRNNGGGNLTTAQNLAARFTNKKVLTSYICHKNGTGHSDFSSPTAIYIEPSNHIRWQKKVAVLTNRSSYSATNDFVNSMKCFPNVTIIGDKTGGGSGLPFSSELPNGWSVRFSSSPTFDANMNQIEFGIEPDIKIDMLSSDILKGKDTIIETARKYLIQ